MTTYNIPAMATTFINNGNGNTVDSLAQTTITVVAPDSATGFSYSYDVPTDPMDTSASLAANGYSITANGGAVGVIAESW